MLIFIVLVALSILGYKMAENKKMGPVVGALLGFLLGLIGILIIYVSKDNDPTV